MLSAGVQHYPSGFGSETMGSTGRMPPRQMSTSGLDALAEGTQYALEQMQHQHRQGSDGRPSVHHRDSFGNDLSQDRGESLGATPRPAKGSSNGQPVRRRISRACDQCNQLRTKCDGKSPCAHCVEFGLTCEYVRERKKRGKASRKDIAAQQASQHLAQDGSPRSGNDNDSDEPSAEPKQSTYKGIKRRRSSADDLPPPQLPLARTDSMSGQRAGTALPPQTPALDNMDANMRGMADGRGPIYQQRTMSMDNQHQPHNGGVALPNPRLSSVGMTDRHMSIAMSEYNTMDDYHRSVLHPASTMAGNNILHNGGNSMHSSMLPGGTMTGYAESPYAVPSPGSQQGMSGGHFRLGESPMSAGFLGQSPNAGSPGGWLSLPSPSAALYANLQQTPTNQSLRYPVLRPLLPHISAILPIGLACDLLELYFSSTSSAFMQPQSPYILGYIFRKRSFLSQHNPRSCSPALLASMLWVAAQTSESVFLTSQPSARGKICQKLLELTVCLLKPLIHTPVDGNQTYGGNTVINGVALGGFGVALPGQAHEIDGASPGATGALDDVATYIHLATVVSASEYKAASLRWWNAAWSLARELKLGRELPVTPGQGNADGREGQLDEHGEPINGPGMTSGQPHNTPGSVSEEEREERRRIWWLLYIVDRHLALCYNRPLFLLDVECDGLLQPEHDAIWQAGEYYPPEHYDANYYRRRGPCFECTGHSIFGYFLPLMTILGEIVDLNHARNHPRFGLRFRDGSDWDSQAAEISEQLEAYGRSLKIFEAQNMAPLPGDPNSANSVHPDGSSNPNINSASSNNNDLLPQQHQQQQHDDPSPHGAATSVHSVNTTNSTQRMTEAILQTRIVLAYSTHLMHTLHILLNGKWDPISLLDDNDLWISSQSFISATSHAVSAAEAINDILDYDPDLSFMPFFFGIYLLQGSFLLLLIADKLQGEASPSVVKACETIVRAHEACVVTLNTEYQRNFRKVMRSALAQVRGRLLEDFGEQQLRRREVLALYRWTGDGTGLAL